MCGYDLSDSWSLFIGLFIMAIVASMLCSEHRVPSSVHY